MALTSALCSAVATILIQRGLRRSNFYAGFWINVLVGVIGLFELTGIATMIITKPEWMGYSTEIYVAIGVVYYLMCAAIAHGARTMERALTRHRAR